MFCNAPTRFLLLARLYGILCPMTYYRTLAEDIVIFAVLVTLQRTGRFLREYAT